MAGSASAAGHPVAWSGGWSANQARKICSNIRSRSSLTTCADPALGASSSARKVLNGRAKGRMLLARGKVDDVGQLTERQQVRAVVELVGPAHDQGALARTVEHDAADRRVVLDSLGKIDGHGCGVVTQYVRAAAPQEYDITRSQLEGIAIRRAQVTGPFPEPRGNRLRRSGGAQAPARGRRSEPRSGVRYASRRALPPGGPPPQRNCSSSARRLDKCPRLQAIQRSARSS